MSETTVMSGREATNVAPGLHVAAGQLANVLAYEGWVGRWSRLFVPTVISAAQIAPGQRVLDVSTGTLFRRVARTPASRDPMVDRELLILADRLDQEADGREEYLERQSERFSIDS